MSVHVTCDCRTHTYTISTGTGQEITGLTEDQWRDFKSKVSLGHYNAGALYRESLARHRQLESA